MAQEAYVKISEVLKDAPALSSVATPFLVAGAIKSRYGNYDVNYFTSRKKFLEAYTCDGKLTGKCDVSLINAYEVLGSAPILVVRAAAENYTAREIKSGDLFSIRFRDFMKDHNFQVVYSMHKSQTYPGAVVLDVKYEKIVSIYKYTFASFPVDGKGTGYEAGEVVTLLNSARTVSIKAKILEVDENGAVQSIKFLTSVGSEDITNFVNSSGGSGSGLKVTVASVALENELVKDYYVIFSLDENVTDDKGNSLYYKNVWKDEYPFEVVLGEGQPTEVTVANPYKENDPTQPDTLTYMDYGPAADVEGTYSDTFATEYGGNGTQTVSSTLADDGSEDIYDDVADPSGKHWAKFEAYEDRHIPMFSDFGVANVGTYLKSLANQFYAMYAMSLPRNKESYAGASLWDDLDLGNSRIHMSTPFALTTNLGFLAAIAPSTQYIATICQNAVAGREFEAVAGKITGVVSYMNLTKKYEKDEREKLLDLKINTITYREVDGYAMFNDDLTGLVQNNPFKEEFNRRLGVRIAQDIDTLMQQFKFRLNTSALRDTVQSVIANYFDTASFKEKIYAYECICNDDNNPPSLQAQNKLAVVVNIAFYYTAKYIEVVNNIYSVGQSFSE